MPTALAHRSCAAQSPAAPDPCRDKVIPTADGSGHQFLAGPEEWMLARRAENVIDSRVPVDRKIRAEFLTGHTGCMLSPKN